MTPAPLELLTTDAHRNELDRAIAGVLRRSMPLLSLTAGDVPLPTFAPALRQCADAIRGGDGVAVVRGLVPADCDAYGRRLRLWAVGLHLGIPVSQSIQGHLIHDASDCVRREGFHTDEADLTALLAEAAMSIDIASSQSVVRTLTEQRPDLAEGLFAPTYDVDTPGGRRRLSLACVVEDRIGLRCPHGLESLPSHDGARRPFTDDSVLPALLAALTDLAEQDGSRRTVRLEGGDLVLVDNYAALHTAPHGQAVRLWLTPHEPRTLPTDFTWTTDGHRGQPVRGGIAPCDLISA